MNGDIGTGTAATLALLADTSRAGNRNGGIFGGGGEGGGVGFLGAEAIANGTATKESIDCNSRQFTAGLQRVSDQAEESRRMAQDAQTNKNITDAEFRNIDRITVLSQLVVDGQKEAALCCCNAKLEACKASAETNALIIQQNSETRALMTATALDTANARIIQLETINALKSSHHGS